MNRELSFIAQLRRIATHPAARGLLDDAAVLEVGGTKLVLTHDMLVEGVHFLPDDPPETVAWKLVAVNLSDLAAKGATPIVALTAHTLIGDAEWDRAFVEGLAKALAHFGVALIADNGKILATLPWKPQRDNLDLIVRDALGWERTLAERGK